MQCRLLEECVSLKDVENISVQSLRKGEVGRETYDVTAVLDIGEKSPHLNCCK